MAHGGYSKGESGTYRLVRTLCKAVQERGCEKSGRMVQFKSFLENEKNITAVPLAPFKGNRFNILFLNGAGTFFLHKHCQEFFDGCKDENLLLKAVYHDLSKKNQREIYLKRKEKNNAARAERLQLSLKEKLDKERRLRIVKENLVVALEGIGGLWTKACDVHANINDINKVSGQRAVLKTQIQFRQKVLCQSHFDNSVFHMSSKGKLFSIDELKINLIKLIELSNQDVEDNDKDDNDSNILLLSLWFCRKLNFFYAKNR